MRFATVCSGIEAASLAFAPLGWEAAFFAEIDKQASALLAHHYPTVPNFGDMTKFKDWPDVAIDLLAGGTPCQAFSVAGLRAGLADPRGNLTLTFLGVVAKYRPRIVVWENVPGVLSVDGGRAFGAFLGGLAELGYGWAYRVVDAQFARALGFPYAVPQRRRRVFVVGYLGDWRRAAAVLFDGASLRGDSPPRREAGKGVAPTLSARTKGGGGLGTDFDLDGGLTAVVASTLPAGGNSTGGARQSGMSAETAATMLVPIMSHDPAVTLTARERKGPLQEADLSTVIAFGSKDSGIDATEDVSPTMRAGGFTGSHANAGVPPAVAYGIRNDAARDGEAHTPSPDAEGRVRLRAPGFNVYEEHAPTLDSGAPHSVAFAIQGAAGRENPLSGPDGVGVRDDGAAYTLEARSEVQAVGYGWRVRRLTPTECERLMGMPDGYTNVPRGNKPTADGPRYKQLGNSWAVNAARVIGERIDLIDQA